MLRPQSIAATKKMRNLLVILIFGICWQNILARGGLGSPTVYSDHEERLQRLENVMLSENENEDTTDHEERLQALEAWITTQKENKDSSDIKSIYFGVEPDNQGGSPSDDIIDLKKVEPGNQGGSPSDDITDFKKIVSLFEKMMSLLSHTDNQESEVLGLEYRG